MGTKSGGSGGPLTARQLVVILIVAAIVVLTALSIRANFQRVDRIDQRTQCILASECR